MRIDKYLLLTIAFFLLASSCKKDPNTESEPDPNNPDNPQIPITYSFSNPLNIHISTPYGKYGGPYREESPSNLRMLQEEVRNGYIYTMLRLEISRNGLGYPLSTILSLQKRPIGNSSNISTIQVTLPDEYIPNSGVNTFGFYSPNFYQGNPISVLNENIPTHSLFTIDKKEEYLYFFCGGYTGESPRIFKWNLTTNDISELPIEIDQLNSLINKQLKCLRVDDIGNLYIASMANEGSIIKVFPSGVVTQIASKLINPGFFEIFNDNLYVPIGSGSEGKVVKIDRDNKFTDVITNLTAPTNVTIDNFGNIVVRSQTTISGANYHRFDVYKLDGKLISNLTDASGYSIFSNTYENMPMHVDNNNNLYFYHADGVSSGGYTSNNPKGQKGIFKIALIRN